MYFYILLHTLFNFKRTVVKTLNMEKLTLAQILIKDATLQVLKLSNTDPLVSKLIDDTRRKQEEILKLKEINQENLRMVVQL